MDAGRVRCFGKEYWSYGPPLARSVEELPYPIQLFDLGGGGLHACAQGAWGLLCGQGGEPPQTIDTVPPLRELSVGAELSCGLDPAGAAWCWPIHAPFGEPTRAHVGPFEHIVIGSQVACGTRRGAEVPECFDAANAVGGGDYQSIELRYPDSCDP